MKKELLLVSGLATVFSFMCVPRVAFSESNGFPKAQLKGTYVSSISRSCIYATEGNIATNADGELEVGGSGADGFPQSRWSSADGDIIFSGDGTGSMYVEVGRMRFNSHVVVDPDSIATRSVKIGRRPLDKRKAECTFEYELFKDRSFQLYNFECYSESVPVGRNGMPSRVTGVEIGGQMTKSGETLLLSDTNTNIERVEVLEEPGGAGSATIKERDRVCVRSGTALRAGN